MGEPEKGKTWAMWGWVRREKAVAGLFVALTLVVGILIGTIVSGHTSAMKSLTFAGKGATPLPIAGRHPVVEFLCFHRESCGTGGGQHFYHAGAREAPVSQSKASSGAES
jgi:hypothetical protein